MRKIHIMINRSNTPVVAPITLAQMLNEMDQALTDEIEKLSIFKQIKHSAVDGKLLSEGSGQYIYLFTLTEPWEPQDDAQLSIANANMQGTKCTVVTSVGTVLTISSESRLPPDVLRQIDLCDDSTELLKRLKEVLKQVDEGHANLGAKSFGLVGCEKKSYPGEIKSGKFQLRSKQTQAARLALGGEVTFIVGPPGTGKTLTLAAIALKHLQAGRRVLIAAHTNIAIDNAIMKLCELCKEAKNEDLLTRGQVVRYGAVQKEEIKNNDDYKEVYLPKIAQHLGSELHTQREQLKNALGNLQRKMSGLQQKQREEEEPYQPLYQNLQTQLGRLQTELPFLEQAEARRISSLRQKHNQYQTSLLQQENEEKPLSQNLAHTEAQVVEKKQALAKEKQNKDSFLTQLVEARAMGGIKRLFKGIKIESLELQVAVTGQAIYELEQSLKSLQARLDARYQLLTQYRQRRQTIEAELDNIQRQLNTPSEEARKISAFKEQQHYQKHHLAEIDSLFKQNAQRYQQDYHHFAALRSQLEAQIADMDKQLRDIEKGIVENAHVVGTTLTKTYVNPTMASKRFDAVIIDEVSMAPLPLVYVAASHADGSVTLIGDPQQLAPIVNATTPIAKKWLAEDLFGLRGISLEAASNGIEQSVLLDVQSRMHPAISAIANKCVYDGKLQNDFNTQAIQKIEPLPDYPLVLCDTHDASPIVTRPPNNKSRKNYYHALCSIALARQALESAPEMKQKPERCIGIVTPYRPQAQLLQSMLKDAGLQNWVQAGTVHRFQGLEFDVVIFDTVESPGLTPGDYIAGSRGSNSMRLINVAVTRPKQKLYIVANLSHLRQELPEQSTLRLAIEEASQSAILPSLDAVGMPFSTFMDKVREQEPLAGGALAVLNHTLAGSAPQHLNRDAIAAEILVYTPARNPKESDTPVPHAYRSEEADIEHFTEATFYDAFKQDIQNARQSICIASPFLAEGRLANVLPLLSEQRKKGIGIEIFTRPLNESKDWDVEAVKKVQLEGIEPVYKSKMHQKAVIIDQKVLYHGSLNALSHRDTEESILRITDLRIIREVYESLRSQRLLSITLNDDALQDLKEIKIPLRALSTTTKCACGNSLVPRLRTDGSGAFFGCSQFRECKDKNIENISQAHFQHITQIQNQACGECGNSTSLHLQGWPQRVLLVCDANCGEIQKIIFIR